MNFQRHNNSKDIVMKTFLVFLIGSAIAASTESQSQCNESEYKEGALNAVETGGYIFATRLYQAAVGGVEGNAVLAPLSASMLLAMMWTGAGGRTALQLADALHLPLDRFLVTQGYAALIARLAQPATDNNEALLLLANSLFIQSGYEVEDSFLQTAESDFRSEVQEVDFAGDTEGAQNEINEWVGNATMGRITNLIQDGFLTAYTRLVLVNAIYFKAAWLHPFDYTTNSSFWVTETEEVEVPTMHGSFMGSYGVVQGVNATALKLPYRGTEAEMVILLPGSVSGLSALENNLDQLDIQYEQREVIVSLPRFEIENRWNMIDDLLQIGITDIFGSQADLHGISEENLYINNMVQEAFITVNENGTEAAAATGVGLSPLAVFPSAEFTADHPFLFLIQEEQNIVFMGRVVNPAQ